MFFERVSAMLGGNVDRSLIARSTVIQPYRARPDDKKYVAQIESRLREFVAPQDLTSHLRLLAAFRALRSRVQKEDGSAPPTYKASMMDESPPTELNNANGFLWAKFVTRALYRFDLYVRQVLSTLPQVKAFAPDFASFRDGVKGIQVQAIDVPDTHLPPLDVALIWHVYRLNPSRILEDSHRDTPYAPLRKLDFPLESLAKTILIDEARVVNNAAQDTWERSTHTPFNPLMSQSEVAPIRCPHCRTTCTVSFDDLVANQWKTKCANCAKTFGASQVTGRAWIDDVQRWSEGGDDETGFRLRGAIFSPHDGYYFSKDPYAAVLLRCIANKRVSTATMWGNVSEPDNNKDIYGELQRGIWSAEELGRMYDFDIDKISAALLQELKRMSIYLPGKEGRAVNARRADIRHRLALMIKNYKQSHPLSHASIDLVGAVQRQFRFVDSVQQLGWLSNPETLDTRSALLRYRAWVALVSLKAGVLVPTLDIDLCWHTHMLSSTYYWDMIMTVGLFLDHEDKVEEKDMEEAASKTQYIWKHAFGQPYTENSTEKKSLLSKLKGKNRAHNNPQYSLSTTQSVNLIDPATYATLQADMRPFYVTGNHGAGLGACMAGNMDKVGYSACLAVNLGFNDRDAGIYSYASSYSRDGESIQKALPPYETYMTPIAMGFGP